MLKSSRISFKRSLESLKGDLKGYDDEEFNAFISHLMSLGYLRQPREGYIELTKEYFDILNEKTVSGRVELKPFEALFLKEIK